MISIIGAGIAGLGIGLKLLKDGRKDVQIFESHQYPGGCAGYFYNQDISFDVGATTLSGSADFFWREHNIFFKKTHMPIGITIHQDQKKVYFFADRKKWIEELDLKFPGHDHHSFWNNLYYLSDKAWAINQQRSLNPPRNLFDLYSFINRDLFKCASLIKNLFTPLSSLIPPAYKSDENLMNLLDEILMISAQVKSNDVNQLIGAMSLTYPHDVHYVQGGIGEIARKMSQEFIGRGGIIHYRNKIEKIIKDNHNFTLHTASKTFSSQKVINTAPLWNQSDFFPQDLVWKKQEKKFSFAWSAITAYAIIKTNRPVSELYHQIHISTPPAWIKSHSIFLSFSDPDDTLRSSSFKQTLTISTHTMASAIPPKSSPDYKKFKLEIEKYFKDLIQKFISNDISFEMLLVGTPSTWQKFTSRRNGLVGGIPHQFKNHIFNYPGQKTHIKNYYRLGDTTFPGQGIVGVLTGVKNFKF